MVALTRSTSNACFHQAGFHFLEINRYSTYHFKHTRIIIIMSLMYFCKNSYKPTILRSRFHVYGHQKGVYICENKFDKKLSLKCNWTTVYRVTSNLQHTASVLGSGKKLYMPHTCTASLSQYHVSDCRRIYDEKLHFWLIFGDTVKR